LGSIREAGSTTIRLASTTVASAPRAASSARRGERARVAQQEERGGVQRGVVVVAIGGLVVVADLGTLAQRVEAQRPHVAPVLARGDAAHLEAARVQGGLHG
jgi:hypothetical protein